MKKRLLLLTIIILSFNCHSQIIFENGYYVDNNNQKTNCLIKNIDWKNNPTEFEYKLSENSELKKASIKIIKEFSINNSSKYVRSNVNIDRSSNKLYNLSDYKNPIFKEEELFLKVLIEGEANLYQYVDSDLIRFFYNKSNSDIEQLIFKSYKNDDNNIAKNNRFRQQLWNNLKCPNFEISRIKKIDYKKNDLIKYFTEYGKCQDNNLTYFESKQKRDLFNLTLRPRLNSSSLIIENSIANLRNSQIINFKNKVSLAFGIEAEFILPFNKNKWSLAIEPTYQRFKSEKQIKVSNAFGDVVLASVDYSSIEIPLSLRHYFYINNSSKVFINCSYIYDLSSKSTIDFTTNNNINIVPLNINASDNIALGIGFKKNDKYSLEVRYHTNRDLLKRNYSFWTSQFKTLALIFGYSIL